MQPTALHVRGINAIRDLSVDLSTVPPGLCAVVGDNGQGKTTLLECMLPAALWLTMPTRPGTLSDACTGRDSLIDLTHVHNGTEYRHLVQVDTGASDKSRPTTEAYLYVDGQPVNDGKLGTYAEEVARWLPPQHLVLASSFAAQDGTGSFARLDVAGRKALFRSMLGLDGLQALADRAALHRRPLDGMAADLDRQAAVLADDRARAADLDRQVAAARDQVPALRSTVSAARKRHVEAQAAHATQAALLRQLSTARDQALQQRDQLAAQAQAARTKADAARQELVAAEVLLGEADAIAAAVAKATTQVQARAQAEAAYREARAELQRLDRAADDAAASRSRLEADLRRVQQQLQAATQADAQLPKLEADAAKLADLRQQRPGLATAAEDAGRAHREADEAAQLRQRAAVRRVDTARSELSRAKRDAEALDRVPCGGRTLLDYPTEHDGELDRSVDCSTCHLLGTAAEARDALPRLQQELADAEAEAEAARGDVVGVADLRAAADAARGAVRDLDLAIVDLAGADTAVERARDAMTQRAQAAATLTELQTAMAALDKADADRAALRDTHLVALDKAEAAGRTAAAALAELGDVEARKAALAKASAEAPLLRRALADHDAQAATADTQRAAVVVPPEPAQQAQVVEAHQQAVQEAQAAAEGQQDALEGHLAALSTLDGLRQALGDLDARDAALQADRDRVARRRAGWVLLERAFGPEGIQALEIDAAGPGVSELCNDLLRTVGAPYTVELRTIREATATRKQREVFDVLVHDGRTGTSRDLSRMSGGEQVLVEESLKLGIAVHVAQHWDGGVRTLWRDETDKGLSLRNQEQYPTMLRLALDRGRFDRCFYITHSPVAAQQADSVLLVRGGRAEVLDPGTYADRLRAGRV